MALRRRAHRLVTFCSSCPASTPNAQNIALWLLLVIGSPGAWISFVQVCLILFCVSFHSILWQHIPLVTEKNILPFICSTLGS